MDYKKTANVKFQGGLGNQLFQFAFALYLKEHFKLNVTVDKSWYQNTNNRIDLLYKFIRPEYQFLEKNYYKYNIINKILSRSEKLIVYSLKKNKLITLKFNGYWQDIYFANYLKNNSNYFNQLNFKKIINGDYYVFHLRRGDFKTSKAHYLLNDQFYIDNYHFFNKKKIFILGENKNDSLILKDKIDNKNIEIANLSEEDSFKLIFNAKGGISSNSSFCWWSIFLSENRNWIMPFQWLKKETIFDKNLQIDKTLVV
mgnify:CR=1 FL=1|jgi:hypothetical protein